MTNTEQRHAIEELVYRSCLALDAKDWKGFLDLCDPGFRYSITAYSPEIRKDMNWLDYDKDGFATLLNNLPKHNSDHSPVTRHATVYTVAVDAGAARQRSCRRCRCSAPRSTAGRPSSLRSGTSTIQ